MKKAQMWAYSIVSFLIGFGILIALIQYAGFENFFETLSNTSSFWIIIAILVYSISWVFRVARLKKLTKHVGVDIKSWDLFKLHVSGFSLNVLLPARLGDIAMALYLKMRGIVIGKSIAIIFQTRILDVMTLAFFVIIPIFLFFKEGIPEWLEITILICILISVIPLFFLFLDKKQRLTHILDKLESKVSLKIFKLIILKTKDVYTGYHEILSNKNLFIISILLSLFIWFFDVLTAYVISIGIGSPVAIFSILLAVSVANVAKSLPPIPGGIGIYEGTFALVLTLYGIPFNTAIVIAILDHGIKNLFTLVFGIPATTSIGVDISYIYETYKNKKIT